MSTAIPPKVAVVDYGAGNLRSVAKALERSGLSPRLAQEAAEVRAADSVVLPGVGAFADAVRSVQKSGLGDAVRESRVGDRPNLDPLDARAGSVDTTRRDAYTRANRWSRPF